MRVGLIFFVVVGCSGACENGAAPLTVTPAILCQHLRDGGCPQGADVDCEESLSLGEPDPSAACASQRNELRRCYWIDLPADADHELASDPATCRLNDACQNETEALCWCENGFDCFVIEQ